MNVGVLPIARPRLPRSPACMTFVYFLLMISPLVFIHELGHFIAARAFGVRVLSFAVGVGPSILSYTRDHTVYALRALPLGGFVLLRGMEDNGDDADDRRQYGDFSLLDVAPWKRMIISMAGPVFSVMTALPIFFGIETADNLRFDAVVGYVAPGSPAADAGLQPGDRVIRADDQPIVCFDDLRDAIQQAPGRTIELQVVRAGQTLALSATPDAVERVDSITRVRRTTQGELGFGVHQQRPRIALPPNLDALPVQNWDEVMAIDGTPTRTWLELQSALEQPRTAPASVHLRRLSPVPTSVGSLVRFDEVTVEWAADSIADHRDQLRPAHTRVYFVEPGSPADRAGLRAGDELIEVGGRAVFDVDTAAGYLASQPEQEVDLVVVRDGAPTELTLELVEVQVTEGGGTFPRVFVGMHGLPYGYVYPEMIEVGWGRRLQDAVSRSVGDTVEAATIIVELLASIFAGKSDSSNIGGPMMIANIAGQAAEAGWLVFLRLAGLISINLGMMNLIPLPGLDGGSILIAFWETVTRRPLSTRARTIISYAGLACLVLIMLFVFKNDLQRYWVDIADWING